MKCAIMTYTVVYNTSITFCLFNEFDRLAIITLSHYACLLLLYNKQITISNLLHPDLVYHKTQQGLLFTM